MRLGCVAFAFATLVAPGCLQDNPMFVEPIGLYGDCADEEDACGQGLACNDVFDPRDPSNGGAYCTDFDCDDQTDCEGFGNSPVGCDPDGNCVISCTPTQRCSGFDCEPCNEANRCAERCGDPSVMAGEGFDCVYCPEEWRCIPVKPGNMSNPLGIWQCIPS